MNHTRTLTATASAALFSLAAALAAPATHAQDVVLGVFVPTTGIWAPIGTDMRNGLELAALGAKVKGRDVKLVIEDTAANPANGLRKAQKLVIEDKAVLLIGGASSAVTLGLNAQAQRLGVPIITTNGQAVAITGEQCSRHLFRTVPNDALAANANAILFRERQDLLNKNWFVVYHDFVYGISNKTAFAQIPGIKIAGEAGRPLGTADWSSAIAQIQASGADGVYLALAVGDDLATMVNQLRSFGIDHNLIVPVGIPDSMLQALGKNGVGMVTGGLTASWTQANTNPKLAQFVQAYVDRYKVVPGYQAINAYAGMQLTLAALEAASDLNTEAIIAALETTRADTVLGPLAIRKEDHQAMLGSWIAEAQPLNPPQYGATVAWQTRSPIAWEQIQYGPQDTGCKGL